MSTINFKNDDGILTIYLAGHIDSNNAGEIEAEITKIVDENKPSNIIIDAANLEYISSAGLRIVLRLKKNYPDIKVIELSSEVYEIFEITGFSEMMDIQKAYRKISVEGCEVIGQGANGKVYRIDQDTIVKEYFNADALPDIKRERELARTALILGIPTAIPYDVVKVGNGYGSVFELLNAKSFAKIIISEPEKLDDVVKMSVELLKKIHSTYVKPGLMPRMKDVAVNWVEFLKDYLDADKYDKFIRMVKEVPETDTMLHGDYHIKNVMLQDGEVLLIDMDTLCVGHPIFEFASIFNAYQGYSELDHLNIEKFLGISFEQGKQFWDKTVDLYFDDKTKEEKEEIKKMAMIIGYARNMRRTIRRNGFDTDSGKALIEHCKNRINELLDEVDRLYY
ncbi:MAG: anti-sigma factor antagonist [Erysipelotrichaceae bacterium]|nr:anti-sigma factor antagonist [Erysipelotrichaceae bacterium]